MENLDSDLMFLKLIETWGGEKHIYVDMCPGEV